MKSIVSLVFILVSSLSMSQETVLEKFQLKVGQAATIMTNQYVFEGVTMDSRCPKDVTCVMAGWAMVDVKITQLGEGTYSKSLKIPADQSALLQTLVLEMQSGEKIVVGALNPYPISTENFEDREYCLELWLIKSQ